MKFRILILFIIIVCASVAAFMTYRSWERRCVSHRPGFRGEVMRDDNGKLLYFNGECWTMRPMPPSDWTF